jgi:hypothetical protein
MIEYNLQVIDALRLTSTGWGVGVPPFKWFKIKGIGGQKMKSEPCDKGPPCNAHFRELEFLGFSRIMVGP